MDQHKYERIDKGVKRTRTIEQIERAQQNRGALANLDDNAIIERIAAGEYVSHMATELGVSHVALHLRLRDRPDYRLAMRCRAAAQLEQQQGDIESAQDALTLARAREGFRAAAWRAEREHPEEWGQKQQIEHSGAIAGPLINIVLPGSVPPESVADMPNLPPLLPSDGA